MEAGLISAYKDLLSNPKLSPGLHLEVLADVTSLLERHEARLLEEKYHVLLNSIIGGTHAVSVKLKALETLLSFQRSYYYPFGALNVV